MPWSAAAPPANRAAPYSAWLNRVAIPRTRDATRHEQKREDHGPNLRGKTAASVAPRLPTREWEQLGPGPTGFQSRSPAALDDTQRHHTTQLSKTPTPPGG